METLKLERNGKYYLRSIKKVFFHQIWIKTLRSSIEFTKLSYDGSQTKGTWVSSLTIISSSNFVSKCNNEFKKFFPRRNLSTEEVSITNKQVKFRLVYVLA